MNGFKSAMVIGVMAALAGAVACGDDEKSTPKADCSTCGAADQTECGTTFDDCISQGGGGKDCQTAVELFCSFSGAFGGDGGMMSADGG